MPLNRIKAFIQHKFSTSLYHRAYSRALFTVFGIAVREFSVSFGQFFTWRFPFYSFFNSLKYCLHALLRICMGRSIRIGYAFTGEDRQIESILKPIITANGFYVDAGCNHPKLFSNTFLFYRRGWRGICIDANQQLIDKYSRMRPRDKAVCALLSDEPAEREYIQLTNNVLSTTETQFINEYLAEGQQITGRTLMQTRSLTSILDSCSAPTDFDFLSVDVEEHDLQVLRSLDLMKYRPRLIIVEAEDFNPSHPGTYPIVQHLAAYHYRLEGFILKNLYFIKQDRV